MSNTIRILLAEDHLTVREGIKLLVNAQPDLEVVGEAGNGEIAIAEAARAFRFVAVVGRGQIRWGLACHESGEG